MAAEKACAAGKCVTGMECIDGVDFLGGFRSRPFCVSLLLCVWETLISCDYGISGRVFGVEKNSSDFLGMRLIIYYGLSFKNLNYSLKIYLHQPFSFEVRFLLVYKFRDMVCES